MKNIIKLSALVLTAMAFTGCASLSSKKAVKAPCGPTAGLTDPCGNRTPINSPQSIDDVQNSLIFTAISAEV